MKFLTPFLLLFITTAAFAQTSGGAAGSLAGKVVDAANKPLAYATVTLLKNDSTVANGALTGEDGIFNINGVAFGQYILRVNALGFAPKFVSNIALTATNPAKQLGGIKVASTSQTLDEVEIVGERAMVEMSIDKKVFNVDKNITATGGSATDVLKNVPSLSVDVDGDVSLRGKGATILIDGKPATLLGGDAASALQSLPASSIQSVEVITNPSAKYDAQGVSGIINIITKKDSKLGLNGNASIGAGTRDKYNAALGLNLKNDKWNLFFNSSYRSRKNFQRGYNERALDNGQLVAGSYEDNTRLFAGWFTTLGAEYTFNEKTSLTLTENLNLMQWGNDGNTSYFNYINGLKDSAQIRGTSSLGSPLSSSTSLDFKHKFAKPRQELTSNVTFANTWVTRTQDYTTRYLDGKEQAYRPPMLQSAPGGGSNTSISAQIDYTMPFMGKNGKIDAGLKTQDFWFESNNHATKDTGNGPMPDATLQNNYNYTQQTHAAYISANNGFGKFGYQAGLRMEYSRYDGTAAQLNGLKYSNEFLNLFPSAYVSYKLGKYDNIYLSYIRRIDRPSFWQMMPYVDVSNPQDTSAGNPALIPEFIHNTELSYNRVFEKGHNFFGSIYYQYTQNLIDRVKRFSDNGNSYTRPENLGSGTTYGVELTGKAQILPIWDASLNLNFFENKIDGGNITADNSGRSWFAKLNTNLKLPYSFSLQVSGNYEAPKIGAQGKTQEVYFMDVALKKNLFKNKASITLNVSDIFNTRKYTTVYGFSGSLQTIYRNRETRIGNITFAYRFGSSDTKSGRRNKEQNSMMPTKDRDNIKQNDGGDSGGF